MKVLLQLGLAVIVGGAFVSLSADEKSERANAERNQAVTQGKADRSEAVLAEQKALVGRLQKRLEDPEAGRDEKYESVTGLGELGPVAGSATGTLAEVMAKSDPHLKTAIAQAFARIGEDAGAAIPVLLQALDAGEEFVRSGAVEALGNIGVSAGPAKARLKSLAKADPSARVRRKAASALKQIETAEKEKAVEEKRRKEIAGAARSNPRKRTDRNDDE